MREGREGAEWEVYIHNLNAQSDCQIGGINTPSVDSLTTFDEIHDPLPPSACLSDLHRNSYGRATAEEEEDG